MARRKPVATTAAASAPPPGGFVSVDDLPPLSLDEANVDRLGVQRAAREAVAVHPSVLAARAAVATEPEVAEAREAGRACGAGRHLPAEVRLWRRSEAAWRAAHPAHDGWPRRSAGYRPSATPAPF